MFDYDIFAYYLFPANNILNYISLDCCEEKDIYLKQY